MSYEVDSYGSSKQGFIWERSNGGIEDAFSLTQLTQRSGGLHVQLNGYSPKHDQLSTLRYAC